MAVHRTESRKVALNKHDLLEMIRALPDDEIDIEKLMYTLHMRRQIERGLADVAAGRVVSQEEIEREMEEWHD